MAKILKDEKILTFFGNVSPHVAVKLFNYKCNNNLEKLHSNIQGL